MSPELVTVVMFGALVVLIIIGVPLAWALSGIALFMTLFMWNFGALYIYISQVFGSSWNVLFIALPLFIGMGVVLERSGIADALFEAMYRWSGPLRGGLAIGTVGICTVFAAMCGVAGAACIAMGMIALPAMRKRGYDKYLAMGSIAAPATLGILIPPSVVMIFLGIIGEVSVSRLFIAGLIPGLVLAGLFCLYIVIVGLVRPKACPSIQEHFTWKQKLISLKSLLLPILIIFSVLGSIFSGAATPTEAAAVGLFTVFIAAAANRRLNLNLVKESTLITFRICGMALWIAFGAIAFASTYSALGGPTFVRELLLGLNLPPLLILTGILVIVLVLGMFIDPGGIIWIVGPLSYNIIKALGYDGIWFSVLLIIGIMVGYVSPPFGYNLFYLKAIVPPDITLGDIYRSVIPFIFLMIVGLALMIAFPQIVLWLPDKLGR